MERTGSGSECSTIRRRSSSLVGVDAERSTSNTVGQRQVREEERDGTVGDDRAIFEGSSHIG